MPGYARGRIIKLGPAIHAALRHHLHSGPNPRRFGAETGGPSRSVQHIVKVSPLAAQPQTTRIGRERIAGVGGKLVQREPDGLRGSRIQTQLWAAHHDTRTNKISEGRELGANQVLDFDPLPFILDEEVLIGCKRLDALGEVFDEIFGISGGGLVSNRVHDAEHILGAMINLAHEELLPFLVLLAFRYVVHGANDAHGPSLTLVAICIQSCCSTCLANIVLSTVVVPGGMLFDLARGYGWGLITQPA
jgi:hypothetical protein